MPLLGHWPELLGVLLIGLLVFGPKRMIEMGSSLGKAVREMRESFKDIPGLNGSGIQSFLGQDEPARTPFSASSQVSPTPAPASMAAPVAAATPDLPVTDSPTAPADTSAMPPASPANWAAGDPNVVEGTVERVVELHES